MGEFNGGERIEKVDFLMNRFRKDVLSLMRPRCIKFHGIGTEELEEALINAFDQTKNLLHEDVLIEASWQQRMLMTMPLFLKWLMEDKKIDSEEAVAFTEVLWSTIADKFKSN